MSYWAGEISTRSVLKEKLKRYEQQRLNEKIKEVPRDLRHLFRGNGELQGGFRLDVCSVGAWDVHELL